jgi:O-acetyl-ADP-ribose deacetylase (regulator of RNase III)
MKILKGDLISLALSGRFDVIIHGCNCFCSMGAGIAQQIKQTFPLAFQADLETESGNRDKLGTYSSAVLKISGTPLTIINGYTQYHYSGENVLADYDAISALFARIKMDFSGAKIGYPRIGAGLAGGDWQKISKMIDVQLAGEDHTLVEYLRLQK